MAKEDNDSEFSEQLREQSYFKMAKRSGGSDADDHHFMQSRHSDDSYGGLNIDSTTVDNNLKMLPKKFKSDHDEPIDEDEGDGDGDGEGNREAHMEAKNDERDIGCSGDFAVSESVPQAVEGDVKQSGIEVYGYFPDQEDSNKKPGLDELKIDIPDDKEDKDNASGETKIKESFNIMTHPLGLSTNEQEGLLMASSSVIEKTDQVTPRIAPVYEDISDDAKESSDSADNSEQNENDNDAEDEDDDEPQYKRVHEYSRPVLTMGLEEFQINTSNTKDDENRSIESPSNDNIDSSEKEFKEEQGEQEGTKPDDEDSKDSKDSKELGDKKDQSNKQAEEKSDNESGPSRGRRSTSSNTSQNIDDDDESIPLHVGSEIFITKNQLRRIYIPNAAIYTSRLSDAIFGKEVLEQVALSDEENKLVLLDKAKLRAILTHVVQVFTTQGMQVDDELVLHFLDHKLSNLSANLKAVASQPN